MDGPGVRTAVFFKGCPLSCPWCHNPESQDYGKETIFFPDDCIHCGNCDAGKPCYTLARREVPSYECSASNVFPAGWRDGRQMSEPEHQLTGRMPPEIRELAAETSGLRGLWRLELSEGD